MDPVLPRREFVARSIGALTSCALLDQGARFSAAGAEMEKRLPPAFSVVPVVGDGKWISTTAPREKGYLEPRDFELTLGIKIIGSGASKNLVATTVAPAEFPEQKILEFEIECDGCVADIIPISDGGVQLCLKAPRLGKGQTVSAIAKYKIQISKSYFGFEKSQFPQLQNRIKEAPKRYLTSSPGIKITSKEVRNVVSRLSSSNVHSWDFARMFYDFVWEHIEGIPGEYTSVEQAIKQKRGDCEERACTFIALCRSAGIPARQVWIPNHVWAEIALHDNDGVWHWIPIHTAAYSWFGWTGVHELVLQKGDRFRMPIRNRVVRLIDDWYRLTGPRPKTEFIASFRPLGRNDEDSGPGAREKQPDGRWRLVGNHALDSQMRGE